jgi:hypothetical protein
MPTSRAWPPIRAAVFGLPSGVRRAEPSIAPCMPIAAWPAASARCARSPWHWKTGRSRHGRRNGWLPRSFRLHGTIATIAVAKEKPARPCGGGVRRRGRRNGWLPRSFRLPGTIATIAVAKEKPARLCGGGRAAAQPTKRLVATIVPLAWNDRESRPGERAVGPAARLRSRQGADGRQTRRCDAATTANRACADRQTRPEGAAARRRAAPEPQITRPGFMIPSGSRAALIERMTSITSAPTCSTRTSRRARPMPCSAVTVPPSAIAAR